MNKTLFQRKLKTSVFGGQEMENLVCANMSGRETGVNVLVSSICCNLREMEIWVWLKHKSFLLALCYFVES